MQEFGQRPVAISPLRPAPGACGSSAASRAWMRAAMAALPSTAPT